jgi:hypothetical protein
LSWGDNDPEERRLPRSCVQSYPCRMARSLKLKVFRTPIGFHDAYVAAPSQKAAIEAWGTGKDVFARGEAEVVTEPELTREPLANPGKIIKRLRGTEAEQLAALGEEEAPAPARGRGEAKVRPKQQSKPAPKPKPRPSRSALDEAEAALAEAEGRHGEAMEEIAEREAALARERAALEKTQRQERERLEARRDKAEAAYQAAMERWRRA